MKYKEAVERARCVLEGWALDAGDEVRFRARPLELIRVASSDDGMALLEARRPWQRPCIVVVASADVTDEEIEDARPRLMMPPIQQIAEMSRGTDGRLTWPVRTSISVTHNYMSAEDLSKFTADREGYERARASIAELVRRGMPLSQPLGDLAARMIEGEPPPRGKKKAPRFEILAIGTAVEVAAELLNIYRNEATENPRSACDAVAEAATLCEVPMNYDQVAYRWKQYTQHHW